jgi:hypothetical protein
MTTMRSAGVGAEQICLRDWPPDVRDLLLLARRMLAFHGQEPALRMAHLPAALRDHSGSVARAGSGKEPRCR